MGRSLTDFKFLRIRVNQPAAFWPCPRRISLGFSSRCQAAPLGSACCCRWFSGSVSAARYEPERTVKRVRRGLCLQERQLVQRPGRLMQKPLANRGGQPRVARLKIQGKLGVRRIAPSASTHKSRTKLPALLLNTKKYCAKWYKYWYWLKSF